MGNALATLRRIRASAAPPPPGERCELCGAAVAGSHPHVVNLDTRSLLCACRACHLLFGHEHAGRVYRAVGDRCRFLGDGRLTAARWDALGIPVGLAFFFGNSRLGRTIACYPGPGGVTEADLPPDAWDAVAAACPPMAEAVPDVEAVLIGSRTGLAGAGAGPRGGAAAGFDCYLVPIDACYELVGRLRASWRGFDGGGEARASLAAFFADLDRRCGVRRPGGTEAVAAP